MTLEELLGTLKDGHRAKVEASDWEVVSVECLGYNDRYAWLTGEWMSPARDEFVSHGKSDNETAFIYGLDDRLWNA